MGRSGKLLLKALPLFVFSLPVVIVIDLIGRFELVEAAPAQEPSLLDDLQSHRPLSLGWFRAYFRFLLE